MECKLPPRQTLHDATAAKEPQRRKVRVVSEKEIAQVA